MERLPWFRMIYPDPHSSHRHSLLPRKWVCAHPYREPHWLGRKNNGLILITALLKLFLTSPLMLSPLGSISLPILWQGSRKGKAGLSQGVVQKRGFSTKSSLLAFLKIWSESTVNTDQFMQENIPGSLHSNAAGWIHTTQMLAFPSTTQGHECDFPSLSPAGNSVVFQGFPALCKQQLSWPMASTQLSPTRRLSPFKHLLDKAWDFPGSGFLKVVCVEKVSIETDQRLIFLREQNSGFFSKIHPMPIAFPHHSLLPLTTRGINKLVMRFFQAVNFLL